MADEKLCDWLPRDAQGQVQWPSDSRQAEELARQLFGWAIVTQMDYWIDYATSLLTDPLQPRRLAGTDNYVERKDKAYQDCFQTLDAEQRQMALKLIREVVAGALFSALGHLDQFPAGDVDISLVDQRPDGSTYRLPITRPDKELFEAFYPWVEQFSKHAAVLATDVAGSDTGRRK